MNVSEKKVNAGADGNVTNIESIFDYKMKWYTFFQ